MMIDQIGLAQETTSVARSSVIAVSGLIAFLQDRETLSSAALSVAFELVYICRPLARILTEDAFRNSWCIYFIYR
jgi:hypothetical protein